MQVYVIKGYNVEGYQWTSYKDSYTLALDTAVNWTIVPDHWAVIRNAKGEKITSVYYEEVANSVVDWEEHFGKEVK